MMKFTLPTLAIACVAAPLAFGGGPLQRSTAVTCSPAAVGPEMIARVDGLTRRRIVIALLVIVVVFVSMTATSLVLMNIGETSSVEVVEVVPSK